MKRRNKYLNQECWEYKRRAGTVDLLFVVCCCSSSLDARGWVGLGLESVKMLEPRVSTLVRRLEQSGVLALSLHILRNGTWR